MILRILDTAVNCWVKMTVRHLGLQRACLDPVQILLSRIRLLSRRKDQGQITGLSRRLVPHLGGQVRRWQHHRHRDEGREDDMPQRLPRLRPMLIGMKMKAKETCINYFQDFSPRPTGFYVNVH